MFSSETAPEDRKVQGLPTLITHGTDDPKHYGKVSACNVAAGSLLTAPLFPSDFLAAITSRVDRLTAILSFSERCLPARKNVD
jgi:hypothetical protein